ncbi:hypothetical protein [Chryseobacterium turcicum]|uniref:Uncharacterized protein n=1 Tax=Chryseobacterium turcicum TaxID=2898076 RepID=A0A9Q3YVI1_9FLAO|nr:hypothetical protein [Chryseobacterium turcicum]MCD1117446.1 hypothetical protein [Chryseobacterium turcicum]
MKVKILASENSKLKIPIPIEVLFKTPYKIEINDTKNITTYEYKNNKWEILK